MRNNINPFLATDGYKVSHHMMYPKGTTLVYSNFTPRHGKHSNTDLGGVISFGQQMIMKQIQEMFDEHFFKTDLRKIATGVKIRVCQEIKKEYSLYLGCDYDVSHIEALWDLGYLPIQVKAIPEGTFVPYGVPVLTIKNTKPEFFWLTNFLETLISNMLWMPMTAATTAHAYKKNLISWAEKTDKDNAAFVEFQGHNFGMRGMAGLDSTVYSGLGHATSFLGDDSLPTIYAARKYYGETGAVVHSVNATEHSVMCAGTKEDEIGTFIYLMKQFPKGNLSIVSDTWNLWDVVKKDGYLATLKKEIMDRDGKIIIRPDSGDPVDIICGTALKGELNYDNTGRAYPSLTEQENPKAWDITYINGNEYYHLVGDDQHKEWSEKEPTVQEKGVIELLWDLFGGTTNDQGYKVLDPHIGAIYGDSITLSRANEICKRLEAKGFASTNIVLGIGSFTYQYVTRDTHGFAMKATYCEVKEWDKNITGNGKWITVGREIFKNPITDDGGKKSAKGLLMVGRDSDTDTLFLKDQVPPSIEANTGNLLKKIFEDGSTFNEITLSEIRYKLI